MPVNRDTVVDWMRRFATEMSEHREELVKLDTAIGDGDHGTNMDRGMKKAVDSRARPPGLSAKRPLRYSSYASASTCRSRL